LSETVPSIQQKQLLKLFPQYKNRSFANIVTADETCVLFYVPKRMLHNKILITKGSQRPCIARPTMSVNKVMYVIFFTNQGPAYQRVNMQMQSLTKARSFIKQRVDQHLVALVSGCCITMLCHTKRPLFEIYLKQEKAVELLYPPYSPDAPCDSLTISEAKKHLAGRNIKSKKISVRLFPSV
jgi:hypothetical protein